MVKRCYEVGNFEQDQILNRMCVVTSSIRVIRNTKNYNGLYACQIGIMTDISLQGLWRQDQNDSRLGVSYMMMITRRVNQNPTKNLFSVIQSVGGTHAHINAVEAKQRLKLTTLS
jgi:hypothetical protein